MNEDGSVNIDMLLIVNAASRLAIHAQRISINHQVIERYMYLHSYQAISRNDTSTGNVDYHSTAACMPHTLYSMQSIGSEETIYMCIMESVQQLAVTVCFFSSFACSEMQASFEWQDKSTMHIPN